MFLSMLCEFLHLQCFYCLQDFSTLLAMAEASDGAHIGASDLIPKKKEKRRQRRQRKCVYSVNGKNRFTIFTIWKGCYINPRLVAGNGSNKMMKNYLFVGAN